MDVKLSPDGTEAVFWFTGPNDSSYVNNSSISYNLDGDLKWGYLNWVMAGSADSLKVDLVSYKHEITKINFNTLKINLRFKYLYF